MLCSQVLLPQLLVLRACRDLLLPVPSFCWLLRCSVQKDILVAHRVKSSCWRGKALLQAWAIVKRNFSSWKIQVSGQRATFFIHHEWPCQGNMLRCCHSLLICSFLLKSGLAEHPLTGSVVAKLVQSKLSRTLRWFLPRGLKQ